MTRLQPSALLSAGGAGRSVQQARLDHAHSALGIAQRLFSLTANMNVTTDQPFVKAWDFTDYLILGIRAYSASINLTTAAGGIYTAAAKGGFQLVGSGQVYTALSAAQKGVLLALSSDGHGLWDELPILSLTTAQGAAATAEFEIWGIPKTVHDFN